MSDSVELRLDPAARGGTIPPELYGHFAEHIGRGIYEGLWVGPESSIPNTRGLRNDVLEALRQLDIPVLRWPGGCFADAYHWRDGIGPRDQRPRRRDPIWGNVIETNAFGTHEFMDLVELLGCKAYVAANLGSGTVQEMSDWVEYLTGSADSTLVRERRANGREQPWHIDYLGVGNENWVCGGNMRPEYYADEFRRYNCFVRPPYLKPAIHRIACGPNEADYRWTEVLMERAGTAMDGLSLHAYSLPTGDWKRKGPATGFDENQWFSTLRAAVRMDELITRHSAIMDRTDPDRRVNLVVDEWGAWYDTEPGTNPRFLYQQNTLRDALVAAVTLHIFHQHADRVRMANLAQTINVLQSLILTDGPRMLRTPTYHVFELFKCHQGAERLYVQLSAAPTYTYGADTLPALSVAATRAPDGTVNLTLANLDPHRDHPLSLRVPSNVAAADWRVLTAAAMDAHNTFDEPDRLVPAHLPAPAQEADVLQLNLPAKSVARLSLSPVS
ncbi:alpha-N-arabinofuranosidase [Actomonas aquatica]|uniref:non-reducing end alpha-L-arabinofuranosidase n=1 Tax=Actomonas aquatica TaxID=2866162 RepID=A0ABZ1CD14_9BACT|nr:alpha-L-arabinofuranosidase C-terminal domain-containing protein [Opitutus sp. WL0086]WRQ89564.1 alpha-L-arabinofuranosidase C-terminal domain-containing protein [Opitutus sp. WL0086]